MSQARSILYLVPSVGIGGAETFIQHAAKYHERYRPIFVLFREGPLAEWFRREHPRSLRLLKRAPRLSRPLSVAAAVGEIAELGRREDVALIHSTMAYGALFGSPASIGSRVPHVWFQHGPVSGWMDRLAGLLPARAVLTNSRFTERRQRELQPVSRELIPFQLGVDLERAGEEAQGAQALRARLLSEMGAAGGESPLLVGMFCRMQAWKGVHLFLDSVRSVEAPEAGDASRSDGRRVVGFVFGGGGGKGMSAYEREMKARAEASGSVRLMGPTDRPLEAIAAMDVVVNASITPEPFGLTLIEAMAAGRAPVAPRHGGPLDFIEEGVNGLFFAPGDANDLARALSRLANDPELLRAISESARARARERFDARKSIAALESIYDQVLGSDPGIRSWRVGPQGSEEG